MNYYTTQQEEHPKDSPGKYVKKKYTLLLSRISTSSSRKQQKVVPYHSIKDTLVVVLLLCLAIQEEPSYNLYWKRLPLWKKVSLLQKGFKWLTWSLKKVTRLLKHTSHRNNTRPPNRKPVATVTILSWVVSPYIDVNKESTIYI